MHFSFQSLTVLYLAMCTVTFLSHLTFDMVKGQGHLKSY